MQAVTTKFLSPTNRKPGRIKASCERGSVTVEWEHGVGVEENHRAACSELLAKFASEDVKEYGGKPEDHHWGEFVTGSTKDCYVHVLVGRRNSVVSREVKAELAAIHTDIANGGCRGGIGMQRISRAIESVIKG